jgi:hypothetical protein
MNAPVTNKAPTILDLDALMDLEMDSVETLPDYVTPAPGVYMLKVDAAGIKENKANPAKNKEASNQLQITYSIMETLECSDNQPFPNGSMFNDRFQATEDGLTYFKKQAMKILNVTDMTGAKLRDIFETLTGVEFKAVVTHRTTQGADGKEYVNISVRPVHEAPAN